MTSVEENGEQPAGAPAAPPSAHERLLFAASVLIGHRVEVQVRAGVPDAAAGPGSSCCCPPGARSRWGEGGGGPWSVP